MVSGRKVNKRSTAQALYFLTYIVLILSNFKKVEGQQGHKVVTVISIEFDLFALAS